MYSSRRWTQMSIRLRALCAFSAACCALNLVCAQAGEDCLTGCHRFSMLWVEPGGQNTGTEYDPPKAYTTFFTPYPDGGVWRETTVNYRFRSYYDCYPLCNQQTNSGLGACSDPGMWFNGQNLTTCVPAS